MIKISLLIVKRKISVMMLETNFCQLPLWQPHATLLASQLNCVKASLGWALMGCKASLHRSGSYPHFLSELGRQTTWTWVCIFFSSFPATIRQWHYSVISLLGEEWFAYLICTRQVYTAATFEHYQKNKRLLSFHCHGWENFQTKVSDYLSDAGFRQLKMLSNVWMRWLGN